MKSENHKKLIKKFCSFVRPLKNRSVVELSEEYLKIKEGDLLLSCSFDLIPYFKEVAESSRTSNKIAIVAGARCGKTITLQAIAAAAVSHYRESVLFMHSNEKSLIEFTKNEFNYHFSKIINLFCSSEDAKAENNQTNKIFNNGNFLNLIFPTSSNFRSKQCHYFLMTEFDAYENLNEGCLLTLASKRTMVLDGCVIAESTPKFTAKKHSNIKHGLPNAGGIVSAYNKGSRAFYYWTCPNCNQMISPNYKDLIHKKGDFFVVCNQCSFEISEEQKQDLNNNGVWIHADQERKDIGYLSYYLSPIFAAFLKWEMIYFEYQDAIQDLKINHDSEKLRSFLNVTAGLPFVESDYQIRTSDNVGLDNCSSCSFGVVPDDAFFIFATVDAQGGKDRRFEVCIFAYCEGQKTTIIKRYSINHINNQPLEINTNIKHFEPLKNILEQDFSNKDETQKYNVVCIGIDSGGEAGYLDNLKAFYNNLSSKLKQRFFLLKGSKPFKNGLKTAKSTKNGYLLYLLDTHYFKSILFSRLQLTADKEHSYSFYKNFPVKFKNEIESEELINNKYVKKRSNETLDLLVYSLAIIRLIGAKKNFNHYKKIFSVKYKEI